MYEAFFGLTRRPFTATPDPACCLALPQFQAALGSLKVCLEQQQGIGLLVGAPGTGKTLLCERLKAEWSDRGRVVFLRHGNFGTRRALLQTILSELGQSYQHPSDQELRLQLTQYLRELRATEPPVLLICDEASGSGKSCSKTCGCSPTWPSTGSRCYSSS